MMNLLQVHDYNKQHSNMFLMIDGITIISISISDK
jgi:hypothetical protein